jgi:hypothetical protein
MPWKELRHLKKKENPTGKENNMNAVRIAGVQGFYGDSPFGAMNIVLGHAADFLVHDALAELTLSILQKDRQKDPSLGYARDIELLASMMYPTALKKGIRIVTNSGGLNPEGAAKKVASILQKNGIKGVKIACITGDDLLAKIPELIQSGEKLNHLETGEAFSSDYKITHANIYAGASSVKEALDKGANLIFAGRIADPCLTLGILAHHYNWNIEGDLSQPELDKLASGITIGHILECGGQASGGNSYAEWPMEYPVSNLGYPIAHVSENGSAIITKLESQGGKVSRNTIREQLVYEIHDPSNYITPDITVDLTEIKLEEISENKVQVTGAKGKPRPDKLKLAMGRFEGYMSDQFFFFSWPYAYEKAQKFIEAVKETWSRLPVKIERQEFQLIGINGINGEAAPFPDKDWLDKMNEIGIRIVIKHSDERTGKMAFQSIIGLGLNGPPGVVGIPGWGKTDRALLSLWPTLIDRKHLQMKVDIIEI